ncbi:hypothetical protein CQJ94_23985 [Glycomyces fuscus]|nr:hypothetical protein CQJ94_23985 [Glycomyces fuscus]
MRITPWSWATFATQVAWVLSARRVEVNTAACSGDGVSLTCTAIFDTPTIMYSTSDRKQPKQSDVASATR